MRFNPQRNDPMKITLAGISHCDGSYRIVRPKSYTTVIEYVLKGEGYINFGEKTVPVTADSVYILPKGMDQDYYSSEHDPWEKIFINLSGDLALLLTERFGLNGKYVFDGTGTKDAFLKIAETVRHSSDLNDAKSVLTGLFTEILARLSHGFERSEHSGEAVALKDLIDRSSDKIIGNDELAKSIFRSPDYCVKLFKKEYGVTPYEYQIRVKTDMACSLLCGTGMPVFEIARSLGYSDPCYFSGLFKKRMGCSPREYRNK